MRLVYVSPVPYASFAQRPQKFVEWFHLRTGGEVIWIDPYPTRFPRWSDLQHFDSAKKSYVVAMPDWIRVLKPIALPLEPLPGVGWLLALFWRSLLDELARFAEGQDACIVIGKPSLLAHAVLNRLKYTRSIYDAMDAFPAFYNGLSRFSLAQREAQLVRRVSGLWVTSTRLNNRWKSLRMDLKHVPNAFDSQLLSTLRVDRIRSTKKVFGYVGTIAAWFDWEWVTALADLRQNDVIRLIGPVFTPPPNNLPRNIELYPECNHLAALNAMHDFDVGLIPFIRNDLTASVDPIKFYEYRALGLPVISTQFGEMELREHQKGTFISASIQDLESLIEVVLCFQDTPGAAKEFALLNSWETRFDAANLLP